VETKYGDRTLKTFATAIGTVICTLERHRTVYRAWKDGLKDIPAPGPKLGYAVARELAKHPDRLAIIKNNPNITKREATAIMRKHHGTSATSARGAAPGEARLLANLTKALGLCEVEHFAEPFGYAVDPVTLKAAEALEKAAAKVAWSLREGCRLVEEKAAEAVAREQEFEAAQPPQETPVVRHRPRNSLPDLKGVEPQLCSFKRAA
jgi:hypothetical protein